MGALDGAVVVITGASRGIGRAAALAMARDGAHVVCAARSTRGAPARLPGTIEETADAVRALGRRALGVACDVTNEEQVGALAERTMAEFGRVDALVNNAAVNVFGTFAELPMRRWDLVLDVNLRGTALCAKAFLPHMLSQGGGRIINVSSAAATDLDVGARLHIIPYAVSKAAVEALTSALALELKPRIAVNCLRIETSVATEGAKLLNPHADVSHWESPEACAGALVWLAARDSSFTGRIMTVAEVQARVRLKPDPP